MKKTHALLLLVFMALLLASCTGYTTKVHSYPTPKYEGKLRTNFKKDWKNVKVFTEQQLPTGYEAMSDIIIEGKRGSSEKSLLKKLRKEAAKLNADAVIAIEVSDIERESLNGVNAFFGIASIAMGNYEVDAHGDVVEYYETIAVRGIAVRFKEGYYH